MKYKSSFKLFVLLFLFSFFSTLLPTTCIDLTKGNAITPMLHSIAPASVPIQGGVTIIDSPGSYHLVDDAEGHIQIATGNVVLNLNGFTFKGLPGYNNAIFVFEPGLGYQEYTENVTIVNGSVEACENNFGITLRSLFPLSP